MVCPAPHALRELLVDRRQGADTSEVLVHRYVSSTYRPRAIAEISAETATGQTSWDPPAASPSIAPPTTPPAPAGGHKRRQYAAGQTQAYYGAGDTLNGGGGGGYAPPGAPAQPAQLFTPGLATDNQFQQQQQQQQMMGQGQPPYYSNAPAEPEYINAQQAPMYGQPQMNQMNNLADQFGGMNMGQKGPRLFTTNLLTSPPDPREIHNPPPEIVLPPNSCVSPSPLANADHTYQRCTLNAIPTTNSLLKKASVPLGLVLTPYRSLKEGDEPVPLVTDTVIARCRRCRTYINPFVQFIDGGNR